VSASLWVSLVIVKVPLDGRSTSERQGGLLDGD